MSGDVVEQGRAAYAGPGAVAPRPWRLVNGAVLVTAVLTLAALARSSRLLWRALLLMLWSALAVAWTVLVVGWMVRPGRLHQLLAAPATVLLGASLLPLVSESVD